MRMHRARIAGGVAIALLGVAAFGPPSAQAHAIVSPAVSQSGQLQQFTLSVPTEKENATTTKIALEVPSGFNIDSWEPEPGWHRQVQSKGSGDSAVVQKVTWTGGNVPTEEDAVFRFNADASKAQTYTFKVQQSYSDGSVVDWTGSESSDTPAPTAKAVSSLGGSSSTLAVIALVVAAIGLLLAAIGLAGGRRPLT